jgi:hypothetical protein
MNTVTAVLVAPTANANITSSFFYRNVGSNSQGGGVTASSGSVTISSSKFISNSIAVYASSSTVNLYNNNFYSNSKIPTNNNTVYCTTPTLSQSGTNSGDGDLKS